MQPIPVIEYASVILMGEFKGGGLFWPHTLLCHQYFLFWENLLIALWSFYTKLDCKMTGIFFQQCVKFNRTRLWISQNRAKSIYNPFVNSRFWLIPHRSMANLHMLGSAASYRWGRCKCERYWWHSLRLSKGSRWCLLLKSGHHQMKEYKHLILEVLKLHRSDVSS